MTVEPTELTISVKESKTIKVTGASGTVKFVTGDKTIATVGESNGKVTGKKVGSTTVTVTASSTKNGKAQNVKVKINVVPGATSSLTATAQSKGVKLAWKKVTGAKGYKVYRDGKLITTIKKAKTVTYTDKKATKNGKKYYIRVRAYKKVGKKKYYSAWSTAKKTVKVQ